MVLAIHYCLTNHIQFVLESENANFSSGAGWSEFFEPFCPEIRSRWLKIFNHRIKPAYNNTYERICFNIYKKLHPNYVYMFTLFNTLRSVKEEAVYEVEELGLRGSLLENCSSIHKMIWKYNSDTKREIDSLIASLNLPNKYISMHIRQGDKDEEAQLYSPNIYMEEAKKWSDVKTVFVLTDDYKVIKYLKNQYSDYQFYTFCQPNESGYKLSRLSGMTKKEQRFSYLRLWASMDVMEKAPLFVGTYSANPGMNMGFRIDEKSIHCVDFKKWQLW